MRTKFPGGGRILSELGEIGVIQRGDESVRVDPGTDSFHKHMPVHRHPGIQIRAEHAVVLGTHGAQVDADSRHAANAVREQSNGLWRGQRLRLPVAIGIRLEKQDRALNRLEGAGQAFEAQRGGQCRGSVAGRKAGDITFVNRDGLGVLRRGPILKNERRAEGTAVADQQPVCGRHRGDAPFVDGGPGDQFRIISTRGGEGLEQVNAGEGAIQMAEGAEKSRGVGVDALGKFVPGSGPDFLGTKLSAQGGEGEGGPRAALAVSFAAQTGRRRRECKTICGAGLDLTDQLAAFPRKFWKRLAQQFDEIAGSQRLGASSQGRCLDGQRMRKLDVGVDHHEHGVEAVGRFPFQDADGRIGRTQAQQPGAVEEARRSIEQAIQRGEFWNDIILTTPGKSAARMHIDLLGGEPFHAAGEAEAAVRAGQGTQPVAQEGPGASLFGEPVVVVRFAVVYINADALALLNRVIEIPRNLSAAVILKQLRVGPLHSALGEQRLGGRPRTAKSLQEKNGFGKFLANPRDDVLPDGQWNLVASIAAKAVHTASAPREKCLREILPQRGVVWFDLDEILPDRSPGAGTFEVAVRFAQEPFGMIFLQGGAPAGVINDDVEKDPGSHPMGGFGKFAELIDARCSLIEFHQGRIDRRQILAGIGAAKTAEARVSGGRRADRQQMNDAAPESVDDMWQLANDIAQFARRRNHRVTLRIEYFQFFFCRWINRLFCCPGFSKHSREGAVDGVARAIPVRMHRQAQVRTVGPDLKPLRIDDVTLRVEITDLGQRQVDGPGAVGLGFERDVAPE